MKWNMLCSIFVIFYADFTAWLARSLFLLFIQTEYERSVINFDVNNNVLFYYEKLNFKAFFGIAYTTVTLK